MLWLTEGTPHATFRDLYKNLLVSEFLFSGRIAAVKAHWKATRKNPNLKYSLGRMSMTGFKGLFTSFRIINFYVIWSTKSIFRLYEGKFFFISPAILVW